MKKKLIYLIIGLVVVSALVVGSYYSYYKNSVKDISSSLELIQESLTETVVLKEVGDLLQAKNKNLTTNYTWAKVETMAANLANQTASLSGNYRLTAYKKSVTIWTVKIREAAKEGKTWPDVPAEPSDFIIKLRNNEAGQLLIESLAKINELTQFGNDAIKRKDKETMRYVAAKFLVQKHWLNGLAHYEEAGYFAGLSAPIYVYAATEQINCATATPKDRPWCILRANRQLTDIQTKIDGLLIAAIAYSRGIADAEKNWNEATKQLTDMFKEQGLLSLETPPAVAKIMQNNNLLPTDTTTPVTPSKVQTYKDNCLASGGKLGGVNKGNGWLPTSEDGNYCNFKNQEKNCWNFLTYSGSYFAGGDSGCEQHNILPAAIGPNSSAAEGSPSIEPPTPVTGAKTEPPKTPAKQPNKQVEQPVLKIIPSETINTNPLVLLGYYSGLKGEVGTFFDVSFGGQGGLPPYHFQLDTGVGFPPMGIILDINGRLSGTPTAAGSSAFGVCVVDTAGVSKCEKFTMTVSEGCKLNLPPECTDNNYCWARSGCNYCFGSCCGKVYGDAVAVAYSNCIDEINALCANAQKEYDNCLKAQ